MKCCIPRFSVGVVTTLFVLHLRSVAGFTSYSHGLARTRQSADAMFAFKSHSTLYKAASSEDPSEKKENSLRISLRKATGFSLTALRKTCRAATGISLSAIYLATVAATGEWIRQTTKFVLSIFPPWARYFVQPFLILYYVPIFILRNLTGPTRTRAEKTHEAVLDSWKDAVQKADDTVAYWPIHVDEEGIYSDMNEIDIREGVVESIEIARDEQEKEDKKVDEDKK